MRDIIFNFFYWIIVMLGIAAFLWIVIPIIQLIAILLIFLLIFEPIIFWIIIIFTTFSLYKLYRIL